MLKGLEDFHVRLYSDNGFCYALSQTDWHRTFSSDSLQRMFWSNSDNTLYQAGFSKMVCRFYDENKPMIRYSRSREIGYLNVTRFDFGRSFKSKDSIKVALLMDSIVQEMKGVKTLIIDVRSCQGGNTKFGEIIASRLTNKKKKYAQTVRFINAKDSLKSIEQFISPAGKEQLILPIVVITNKVARSAAEEFILMLKQLPNSYLMGEPTWGAFSSNREYILPNGWTLEYSTDKIYTPKGEIYEGKGIPVDFYISNDWNDIVNKKDKVILSVLENVKRK
jgi:C-terminal processing protease CtpA/Prc